MVELRLYVKRRLVGGNDIRRLVIITILVTLIPVPTWLAVAANNTSYVVMALPLIILVESGYISAFNLFTAFGVLGLFYFATKREEKKYEYSGYGYIIGFITGFLLIIATANFDINLSALVGLAMVGFGTGVFLSFVGARPKQVYLGTRIGL